MKSLCKALPLVVLVFAALEALRIRIDFPYRPQNAGVFLQGLVLWGAFGLLALLPARFVLGFLNRKGASTAAESELGDKRSAPGLQAFLVLVGVMGSPIIAHQVLDHYVGIGASMAQLKHVMPWAEAGFLLLLWLGLLLLLGKLLRPLGRAPLPVFLVLALVSIFVGICVPWRGAGEFLAVNAADASLASEGQDQRPNVLLLVWDTVRARSVTPYGYARDTTPHLADLSAQSTLYEQARSVSCFTFTSHLSMFSGVLPSKHEGRLTSLVYRPDRADVVARTFQEQGYRTGGFVGTDVLSGRTRIRHGFERYDDQVDPVVCDTLAWALLHDFQSFLGSRFLAFSNNGLPHWIQDFQRPGEGVLANALEWIEEEDSRPWFCMVNLYDAHWPYLPLGPGKDLFVGDYNGPLDGYLFRSDRWKQDYQIQPADKGHLVDLYDAEILDLDLLVDGFLGELKLDQGGTAVLMTADHGEAFGEAGQWKHEDVFEPQVHIPFLVRSSEALPEGRRVSGFVSGIDVAPTLLGLAGLGHELENLEMDGLNLVAADPAPDREILVEDRDHMDPLEVNVAFYSAPWKLVRRGLGEDVAFTLHDLRSDENGSLDVAADNPEVFEHLKQRLTELRAEADIKDAKGPDPRSGGAGSAALDALGYTGR